MILTKRAVSVIRAIAKLVKSRMWMTFIPAVIAVSNGHGAVTITFDQDPLPPPGTGSTTETYSESGMEFKLVGSYFPGLGVTRIASGYYFDPDNATVYLVNPSTNKLTFGLNSGSPFDLHTMDLAEAFSSLGAITVQFIGYRHDESIVSTTFTTDGIMDGTGLLTDFESFVFGPDFSNLLRVEIPNRDWALDNLVFSIVPEPGTLALLSGGLMIWALRRRKRG